MNKMAKLKVLSIATLLATIPTNVFASPSETTNIKAHIQDTISLILSTNDLKFTLENYNLHIDSMGITVETNIHTGYKLSFNADNDYNDLKHENESVETLIPSLAEDETASTFPETAWGYSLETENHIFKQIPLTAKTIYETTENGKNTHNFTLGIRSRNLVAGNYTNDLLFTAVANPEPQLQTLADITTMQEITPEIVAATPEHESKQLIDARDNKSYWVTKLKDGNIWMTQNLDYNLSTTTTLTPEDSDVTENWTPSSATIAGAANLNSTNWANNDNDPYSFDPGNYYFDGTYYTSVACNYLTRTCDHFATTTYDLNGEHGHVGNYYNWTAAVASNDTSAITTEGTDMSSSICPKGWRLPHGYQSASKNDFETLNTAYSGVTNSDSVLLANPLFFVRGRYVSSGGLSNFVDRGYYWSSTANSATYANILLFHSSTLGGGVYTSNYNNRSSGSSVRCLARQYPIRSV